jgi:hypothetical protein
MLFPLSLSFDSQGGNMDNDNEIFSVKLFLPLYLEIYEKIFTLRKELNHYENVSCHSSSSPSFKRQSRKKTEQRFKKMRKARQAKVNKIAEELKLFF